ncbi:hypothetical protein BYT27DRAFT_7258645 [Phlegmacium glaucopus]|nr:hypothetical protein BYT27DRAFT_7258645 [Phlegmacium glaucopus]
MRSIASSTSHNMDPSPIQISNRWASIFSPMYIASVALPPLPVVSDSGDGHLLLWPRERHVTSHSQKRDKL